MRLPPEIEPGRDEPLGAHARDGGVNFALWSDHAERIELCLFDVDGTRELRRYELHGPRDGVWFGFLRGLGPGLVYGLRAHGPYAPDAGHRFNPHKLLLDPYAREIVGRWHWLPEHHGYSVGHPDGTRSFDTRDNALHALKARVAAPDRVAPAALNAPRHAASDLVLYELHVKGFSQRHPAIPPDLRGRYAALAHPASIEHFERLGVTALSLLPVQQRIDEAGLAERGLSNYWGYNTLGFFAADPRCACIADDPAAANDEFRRTVAALHDHGIEVVIDVVFNHTPEGSEVGPTISQRGLDHASWYRLAEDNRSRCENWTGCGNTLNVAHPRVAQFVLDSLRYWVQCMGVDGFRFDLAPVLGRGAHDFDAHAAFFTALRQDPLLARAHWIAEPWDLGPHGYQLGRFPGRFLEWNDKFRDGARLYWLRRGIGRGEFARRFTASSDLFHHGARRPSASVNFVAAHDGFTLADCVMFSRKHNDANGEANRDGRDGEVCVNFGVEGPSDDAATVQTRRRVQRAVLATLALAQGTPMLCAGDEIGRTQRGNNNAWCQDNAISWLDWDAADQELAAFVARAFALRRADPALHHDAWFAARHGEYRLHWLLPSGAELQVHDWHDAASHAFACAITRVRGYGTRQHLWLGFNPEAAPCSFAVPPGRWRVALDSSIDDTDGAPAKAHEGRFVAAAHALVVLRPDAEHHRS